MSSGKALTAKELRAKINATINKDFDECRLAIPVQYIDISNDDPDDKEAIAAKPWKNAIYSLIFNRQNKGEYGYVCTLAH